MDGSGQWVALEIHSNCQLNHNRWLQQQRQGGGAFAISHSILLTLLSAVTLNITWNTLSCCWNDKVPEVISCHMCKFFFGQWHWVILEICCGCSNNCRDKAVYSPHLLISLHADAYLGMRCSVTYEELCRILFKSQPKLSLSWMDLTVQIFIETGVELHLKYTVVV